MTVYTHEVEVPNPFAYYVPTLLNPVPYHRIVPGLSPAARDAAIAAIPNTTGPSVNNASQIIGAPTKKSEGKGWTYASLDGVDDQIRLVSTPAISLSTLTVMVVARLKSVSGFQSIFWGMPPGGNRSDLSLWSGVLTFTGATGGVATATHPWTPDTNWHVFTVTQTATAITIGVDDVFQTTNSVTPSAWNGFNVGQKRGGGFQAVDVADAVLFPQLAADYRTAEVKNLMSQYGIKWGKSFAP